ncbi:hypothetical protein [Shewanella woodyi]|uniref:hypothetical protein n=1 Tax=Shewanella woodyi TaxID=60961 RepID=UPI003748C6B0
MIFKVFKLFVRGSYIGHQLSWGKNKAMFFTQINVGLLLSLVMLPLSVCISVYVFDNLFFVTGIVPISSGLLYILIERKLLKKDELYPDVDKMSAKNIRKERLISNIIYLILSVIFVLIAWAVADLIIN